MPTVSILIPNYNHAHHLHQSLTGACNQTRPADQVLVADDGSTDDSVPVIRDFMARYANLTLIRNERNRGLQYTINRLLRVAKTDYIVCAAADDELFPQFIERHLDVLGRHPQAGMSVSEYVIRDLDGSVVNKSQEMPASFGFVGLPEFVSARDIQREFRKRYVWMTSNAIVARRDAMLAVGGFINDQEWHSDWFTYYAVGLRHGVCFIPEGLGLIRVAPGGYSAQGMSDFERQSKVLLSIVRSSARKPNADLRGIFRRAPSLLSVFGQDMARVLWANPRYLDLAIAYQLFLFKRDKRNSGMGWSDFLKATYRKRFG